MTAYNSDYNTRALQLAQQTIRATTTKEFATAFSQANLILNRQEWTYYLAECRRLKRECRQREKRQPMIYFIQAVDGGPIKIGYSIDPQKCLKQIQRKSPVPLQILRMIEGDIEYKEAIHHLFNKSRVRGEWFDPSEELLAFIEKPLKLEPINSEGSRVYRTSEGQRLSDILEVVQSLDETGQQAVLKYALSLTQEKRLARQSSAKIRNFSPTAPL
jgi:hypothetical protein